MRQTIRNSVRLLFKPTVMSVFLALMATLPCTSFAKANSCFKLFDTKPGSITKSAKPVRSGQGLSDFQLEVLRKHAITKFAKNYGNGEKLAFSSMHFKESMDSLYKGEFIQARFVRKILQQIFPKAAFILTTDKVPKGRKKINIILADLAERFSGQSDVIKRLIENGMILPMHILKAANSERLFIEKSEARQELGLPQNRKIISLYVRSEDTLTDFKSFSRSTQFAPLLSAIKKSFPMDIVILTFGNHTRRMGFASSGAPDAFAWKSKYALTDIISSKNINLEAHTLVDNNTVGNMLKIQAAADLAVVVGPINFIEPLRVGTPTLLIRKNYSEVRNSDYGSYDMDAFNELIDIAMPTGLLRRHKITRSDQNYNAIEPLIRELQKASDSGYNIAENVFPQFLDILLQHLNYQIKNFNIEDYNNAGLRFTP